MKSLLQIKKGSKNRTLFAPHTLQLSNQFIEDLKQLYSLEPIIKVIPLYPENGQGKQNQRILSV